MQYVERLKELLEAQGTDLQVTCISTDMAGWHYASLRGLVVTEGLLVPGFCTGATRSIAGMQPQLYNTRCDITQQHTAVALAAA